MPAIRLHTKSIAVPGADAIINPLPQVFQTPSGLAILEIQGTIHIPESQTDPKATQVGQLSFPMYNPETSTDNLAWQKHVQLDIGRHQRLIGEVKKLTKPLAVIRRRATTQQTDQVDDDIFDLEIAGIVYHKLLFASRPEPIGGS